MNKGNKQDRWYSALRVSLAVAFISLGFMACSSNDDDDSDITPSPDAPAQQGTLKVSPTALHFDANGGTQRIEINTKGYEYYGGFADDNCDTWVTCSTSNKGVNVKVSANTTGKERTGTVYAYVTNNPNVSSLNDITYTTIKVTQAANQNQPQEQNFYIESGSVHMYYAILWRWDVNFKATDDGVSIIPNNNGNGRGAQVIIKQKGVDSGANAVWESTISFNVDDLSLVESKKAKISDFKYEMNKEGRERQYYDWHIAWTKTTTRLESGTAKSQEDSGLWYYTKDDLNYFSNETIYYDRWTKDIYSEPEEKTVVNVTEEVTDGSSLFIGLVIKKK